MQNYIKYALKLGMSYSMECKLHLPLAGGHLEALVVDIMNEIANGGDGFIQYVF